MIGIFGMANTDTLNMVVSRTPLRISFAGGGTDFPEFYKQGHGSVLSSAIDKYLYVTVKQHGRLFKENYRLNYSESEQVENLDDIQNDIARECIRLLDVPPPIYISTVADIPAFTGLGSSGSFGVGLLNALHTFLGKQVSSAQLAEEASHVELNVLKRSGGKQDQYAAAFGGLNYFTFLPDDKVSIEPQCLPNGQIDVLFDNLLLFWTGITRDSGPILTEQKNNINEKYSDLIKIREHSRKLKTIFHDEKLDLTSIGSIVDSSWNTKSSLANPITTSEIDHWYSTALSAGALGGKLCGAGGGGFLLLIAKQETHNKIRNALSDLTELNISYEPQGCGIIYCR